MESSGQHQASSLHLSADDNSLNDTTNTVVLQIEEPPPGASISNQGQKDHVDTRCNLSQKEHRTDQVQQVDVSTVSESKYQAEGQADISMISQGDEANTSTTQLVST